VLLLLNAVEPESLKVEEKYKQLYKDIEEECSTYGPVQSIKIPKPQENYKRNLKNIHTNVGKIFVQFSNLQDAQSACHKLHGKQYLERTILVSYIPESDYELNIF
jgi:splicing factor U2AF subunit